MELKEIVDVFLHLDKHLTEITTQYQGWTYAILFAIIFIETGFVVMPFLPGDSLLFAAGAIAALDNSPINVAVMMALLFIAAVSGDTLNYHIGKWIGPKAFSGKVPLLKVEYLNQTQAFYNKHGGKTIIMARFVPIVRTFAPFVAGIGTMNYGKFISYNVIGGAVWIVLLTLAGYWFGNIEMVKKNFSVVVLAIIFISVLPIIIEAVKAQLGKKSA